MEMFIQKDPALESRRRLAEALSTSRKPVSHWSDGLSNAANAIAGKLMRDKVDTEERERNERAQKTLADALSGQTWTNPDTQETKTYEPSLEGMAKVLAGNPDTAQMGLGLQLQGIQRRAQMENNSRTTLSPEEISALGLPPGTIAQRTQYGGLDIVHLPGGINQATPSKIQVYEYYNRLTPEQRRVFDASGRSTQYLDLGGKYIQPESGREYGKTLAPNQTPEVKAAQAAAQVEGQTQGERVAEFKDRLAALPRLRMVAQELSDLGKKATYTTAGQLRDAGARQLGMNPTEGAIARKEYISKVDNEVLPLLRQTFGAAFTQKEGESLKATLGDPDAAPAEKDAVLRSFIQTKVEQIKTSGRVLGLPDSEIDALLGESNSKMDASGEVEATKEINGTKYIKINGQWYEAGN